MKTVDYINIQGWMIGVLNLKGNELLIYAIIYGFSRDDKTKYKGSLSYISQGIRISKSSCIKSLNKLENKGLIIKYVSNSGNEYQYNNDVLKHLINGSVKSTPVEKVHTSSVKSTLIGGVKSTHNINTTNNNNNNRTLFPKLESKGSIDFNKLLEYLNTKTGKKARVVNNKVKSKFKALLKEGYLKKDIVNAINNASQSPYHIENNFMYLNISFFSRSDTIDKYGFNNQISKTKNTTSTSISDGVPIG